MKATVVLSLVSAALGSALFKRECSGNNCNRQVTGTRAGLLPITERQADCSSFQAHTVTPEAVTTTVTLYEGEEEYKFKREVVEVREAVTDIPPDVPAYASSCDEVGEYASACSCWGITASTTTAAAPTVTVTVTADACEEL